MSEYMYDGLLTQGYEINQIALSKDGKSEDIFYVDKFDNFFIPIVEGYIPLFNSEELKNLNNEKNIKFVKNNNNEIFEIYEIESVIVNLSNFEKYNGMSESSGSFLGDNISYLGGIALLFLVLFLGIFIGKWSVKRVFVKA